MRLSAIRCEKELPVEIGRAPRPGGPMTFSLEQILQPFATEKPGVDGPSATARELADEGVKQVWRHLCSACGTIDERSRFETAPVAILVESRPEFDQKSKTSVRST